MKNFLKYIISLFVLLTTSTTGAQNLKQVHDSVSVLLLHAFNTEDPLNTYVLTSSAYQKKMDVDKFSEGLKKFNLRSGKWKGLTFKEPKEDGFTYLADFENDKQILFLRVDEYGKILRFNFTPIPLKKMEKIYFIPSDNPMVNSIDSLVERLVRPYIQQENSTGLCIAIIEDRNVYKYCYGEVVKGGSQLPDPATSIFEIGSVTKTFTSLLLALQVVKKKISLKDPINKFLPSSIPTLKYEDVYIKLINLANHTSGLPRLPSNIFLGNVNPEDPYKHYNRDSLLSYLKLFSPTVKPGSQFSYSNYGAGLLGNILADISHRSFEQLVEEEICVPLQMKSTRISLNERAIPFLVQGYTAKGEVTSDWDLGSLQGSGAIKSTLNDMIRYTQAQLGQSPTNLKKALLLTHHLTFQDKDNAIGLGWRIEQGQARNYLHHSGGTGGFRSFVGFDKKRQIGVVILSNTAEDVTGIGEAFLKN